MIGIEDLCLDVREALRAKVPPLIVKLAASTSAQPVNQAIASLPPIPASYYIGPYARYTPYQLPAVFIIPPQSTRVAAAQVHDEWHHQLLVMLLVEANEIEVLQRTTMRLAEAVYGALHDQDPTPDAAAEAQLRSAKLYITHIAWGSVIAPRDKASQIFRMDCTLTVDADMHAQATPMG